MSLPPRALRLLLLGFILLGELAYAAEGDGNASADAVCKGDGPQDEGCPLQGNGDFYGLGVRMGIYLQWLTSWLANNFLQDEIISSLDTNSIFLLALFSIVSIYSAQKDQIRVVDVLIIHQLCVGFLFSIMSLWGYRTMYYKTEGPGGRRHFGGFGTHFRLVLMSAITLYGAWFWAQGVETLSPCDRRTQCGGLDSFFFAPQKVESWTIRGVNLVIGIVAAVYYGVMTIVAAIAGLFYVTRKLRGREDNWELIGRPDQDVALDRRELTIWYITLSIFNLFWIIFAIISIEFTIALNHMHNVVGGAGINGAGQLIPLLIGMISLVKVLYELARQNTPWLRKKGEEAKSEPTAEEYTIASPTAYSFTEYQDRERPEGAALRNTLTALPNRTATVRRPRQKRSLTHRILLAWLPWLNMFEWSRESLTPPLFRNSSAFGGGARGKQREEDVGFETLGPRRTSQLRETRRDRRQRRGHIRGQSSTATEGTEEGSTAALLASPPHLAPDQRALMATTQEEVIEMPDWSSASASHSKTSNETDRIDGDIGAYEGKGYYDCGA